MDTECGCHTTISRRRLGSMLAGAAALSILPVASRAAGHVDTLCVTCIDYRFVTKDVTWLNTELGLNFDDYDIVALAGASLAGIDTKVPQKSDAFWDQVKIAKSLHGIKRVVLLDHMDCGAYKEAYGPLTPPQEESKHREVISGVAGLLRSNEYKLMASGFIMPLKGMPIHVTG